MKLIYARRNNAHNIISVNSEINCTVKLIDARKNNVHDIISVISEINCTVKLIYARRNKEHINILYQHIKKVVHK